MIPTIRSAWFVRNVVSSMGASVVGSIAQLVLVISLARLFPQETFAAFITANALVGVLENASHFGTSTWAMRHFAGGSNPGGDFSLAVRAKALYSACTLLLVFLLPIQNLTGIEVLLCCLIAITQASGDPLLWYLVGRERLDLESLVVVLWRIASVALVLSMAYVGVSLAMLLVAWLVANVARLVLEARVPLIGQLLVLPRGQVTGAQVWNVVSTVFPLGVASVLYASYHRIGVLLLQYLGSAGDVATFGAAFSLIVPMAFIAVAITRASFPALTSAMMLERGEEARLIVSEQLRLISVIFVPIAVVGTVLSPWVVGILYGPTYMPAIPVMAILVTGLYVSNLAWVLQQACNAGNLNWQGLATLVLALAAYVAIMVSPFFAADAMLAAVAWTVGETISFLSRWQILARRGVLRSGSWIVWLAVFLATAAAVYVIYPPALAFFQAHADAVHYRPWR